MIRSPYRYPGAKNKMLHILMPKIEKIINKKFIFSDAFVGGGSVLLEVASKFPKIELLCNDKDIQIFSFWKTISSCSDNDLNDLFDLINQKPTIDLFFSLKEKKNSSQLELAYKSIFFNRTSFSGINKINSSPIGGKWQKSKYKIDCRYNSIKIIDKIKQARKLLKGRLITHNDDIIDYINSYNDVPTYLDPPYFVAGKQLYQEYMSYEEHKNLCTLLNIKNNWILSYDNCIEIIDLYKWANIEYIDITYSISGSKTEWKKCKEIIVEKYDPCLP